MDEIVEYLQPKLRALVVNLSSIDKLWCRIDILLLDFYLVFSLWLLLVDRFLHRCSEFR